MVIRLVVLLFFPWIDATIRAAYNEYLEANPNIYNYFNEHEVVSKFLKHHADAYMKKAFKKHWHRIIFRPWTIVTFPELYEVS